MKELNSKNLLDLAKKLGIKINEIYCRDEKIKIIDGCYIINLDTKRIMIGTHWTAFYKKNKIFYFDSYGMPPPQELLLKFKLLHDKVYYNDIVYQKIGSNTCGYFSIYFLFCMVNHVTPYQFLYKVLNPFNITYNEKLLKNIFNLSVIV